MNTRSIRRSIGVPTRDSSRVRRAAIVPANVATTEIDQGALSRLLATSWAVRAGELKPRALPDLRHRLRAEGKHATLALVAHVRDTWLDRLGPTLVGEERRALALEVGCSFARIVHEHALSSPTALRHALRGVAAGVLSDRCTARLLSGEADETERKLVDRLATMARTETLTALQIEAQAREAHDASGHGWDAETMARFERIAGGDSKGGSTGKAPGYLPDADRASTRPAHASDSPQPGLPSDPEPDSPPQPGLSTGGDS